MPVEVGPDGGVGIEILFAVNIAQHRSFTGRDDNRLAFKPVAHLGERMLDVGVVELSELVHAPKVFNARRSSAISDAVCAAVSVTRNRAAPRATVG